MIVPPYLKQGDTIALVCPSGFMPQESFETCISVLQQWGFNVKRGATAGSQFHYFSGTDEERLNDLQQMMDDASVKAILCARGGYGLSRIIDDLNFKKFVRHPKWIIGFSDITVLQAHIFQQFKIATLHAPMAAAFNDDEYNNEYVQSLKNALLGQQYNYTVQGHPGNRTGKCEGRLVGGNLSLITHLVNSVSSFNTKNKILFLEDVGEYLYNIDRMMIQLKRAGMLSKLRGLIFGGFTNLKDTITPFGTGIHEILQYHIKDYDYPVCYDFPVSHERENLSLKVGVKHKLIVNDTFVQLLETK